MHETPKPCQPSLFDAVRRTRVNCAKNPLHTGRGNLWVGRSLQVRDGQDVPSALRLSPAAASASRNTFSGSAAPAGGSSEPTFRCRPTVPRTHGKSVRSVTHSSSASSAPVTQSLKPHSPHPRARGKYARQLTPSYQLPMEAWNYYFA